MADPMFSSYLTLIQNNCRAIASPMAVIEVVTARNPTTGLWHVRVLKTEARKRGELLAETHAELSRALEQLHTKSAEAVHQYGASSEGFDLPPMAEVLVWSDNDEEDEDEDNYTAVHSGSEASDTDSDAMSACSSSLCGGRRRRKKRGPKRAGAVEAVSRKRGDMSHDEGEGSDGSGEEMKLFRPRKREPKQHGSLPLRKRMPVPPMNNAALGRAGPLGAAAVRHPAMGPMAPIPPGWNPGPKIVPFFNPPRQSPGPAPVPVSGPPLHRPMASPAMQLRLQINRPGYAPLNMAVQCVPSQVMLAERTVREAREHPERFRWTPKPGMPACPPPPPYPPVGSYDFRASVRRVHVDGDAYEVSGFGDDLAPLLRCAGPAGGPAAAALPKIEVELTALVTIAPKSHGGSDWSKKSAVLSDGEMSDSGMLSNA